ncbi:Predicted nucleic acid-binding protein, contains PIN domain [Allochromatium warmingii]|uniref:Predicted nucleic acid-binding protein, contains PIN domain n=1 Tax=Allochromatium warmingii TaxID=61595 RepID=A0A1H3GER2_ALLWA|nr:PIN domain-containing protein [Allochromatium warmingii]SDY00789.1 Predicted nucleic acid-binding protein, contains PIN domain [Allochromatium warmingii]
MSTDPFIDTNIWIYAHLKTPSDLKGDIARKLVESDQRFVISTQVLNEYYAAMLKNKVTDAWIQNSLEKMIQNCELALVSLPVIRQAYTLKNQYCFSLWDSLIISSALEAGCAILYSEDLQHEQRIADQLTVCNPFKNHLS